MTSLKIDNPAVKKALPVVLIVGVVVALLYLLTGGSGGNAGAVIEKQASVMENYINGMESAKSADDVVKAIELYTAEMKKLIPELQKFHRTYGIDDASEASAAQMEKEMDRIKEGSEKLPAAMMKAASYMMDEKVQKAFAKMGEELGSLEEFQ